MIATIQLTNILCQQGKDSIAESLFHRELRDIHQQAFKLRDNYTSIELDDFISLDVAYVDNELIGFCGLQYRRGIFPDGYVRMGTRLYISPKYRRVGLKSYTNIASNQYLGYAELTNPSVNLFYQRQLDTAISSGFKGVFFTRYSNRWKAINRHLEYVNSTIIGANFTALSTICNVCNQPSALSCWQYVGGMSLTGSCFETDFNCLPNVSVVSWESDLTQSKETALSYYKM